MAISIDEQYPGKTTGTNTNYPYGEARNVTSPGDGTGTPWEKAIVNDDQGFKQALLIEAGIVPSGTPDTALESQYLGALKILIGKSVPTIRDRHFLRFVGSSGSIVKNSGGLVVSRLATGDYEVTLPTPAPDVNYMVFLSGSTTRPDAASIGLDAAFTQTTTKFRIKCRFGGDNTLGSFDPGHINVRVVY